MDAAIRGWTRDDVPAIGALWVDALGDTGLHGVGLHADAPGRLRSWLLDQVRERSVVGLVAEVDGRVGGFLLGRVGEWDSIPPITRPGRVGLVDVVCVAAELRGRGVGSRLAAEAVGKMEAAGAERIETTYDPGNPAAARLWERMGFRPSLRRAWRPGGP